MSTVALFQPWSRFRSLHSRRFLFFLLLCPQSRLRRQDVGLKTHLDQLDQQISELQLDVSRSSCEALDSDSRPSSGTADGAGHPHRPNAVDSLCPQLI